MNAKEFKMSKALEQRFSQCVKDVLAEAKAQTPEMVAGQIDLHAEAVSDQGLGVVAMRVMLVLDPGKAPAPDPGIPAQIEELLRMSQATLKNRARPRQDPPKEA